MYIYRSTLASSYLQVGVVKELKIEMTSSIVSLAYIRKHGGPSESPLNTVSWLVSSLTLLAGLLGSLVNCLCDFSWMYLIDLCLLMLYIFYILVL